MNNKKPVRAWCTLVRGGTDKIHPSFIHMEKIQFGEKSCLEEIEVEIIPVEQVDAMRNELEIANSYVKHVRDLASRYAGTHSLNDFNDLCALIAEGCDNLTKQK